MNTPVLLLTLFTIFYIITSILLVIQIINLAVQPQYYTSLKYIITSFFLLVIIPILTASLTHSLASSLTDQYFIVMIVLFTLGLFISAVFSILGLVAQGTQENAPYYITSAVFIFVMIILLIIYGVVFRKSNGHVP